MLLSNVLIALVVFAWLRLLAISTAVVANHTKLNRREDPSNVKTSLEGVTILIPAYNEAAFLPATLESMLDLIEVGADLVVVDDGSTDNTAEIARKHIESLGVGRLLNHRGNLGKAAALNTGILTVESPFVLTLDADTIVSRDAVTAAINCLHDDALQSRGVAGVAFDVSAIPSATFLCELQAVEYDGSLNFERRGQWIFSAVSVAPGAASLWRAADLAEIGGFSAETSTEDVDATLCLAARGKRAAHCAGARAFTTTPDSFGKLVAQRHRWCLGHYQCIPRHMRNLGHDVTFSWLTYPNFVFLSAFMPGAVVLSLATLFTEAGIWIDTLGLLTIVWLSFVYAQRWVALRIIDQRARPLVFLVEPFSTMLLHVCAILLVVYALMRRLVGVQSNVWATKSR